MKHWKLPLILLTSLAVFCFAQETENKADKTEKTEKAETKAEEGFVSLRTVFNHRSAWPRTIKLTKDLKVGDKAFAAGDTVLLVGLNSTSLKVAAKDRSRHELPLEATSLVADIESKLGKELARTFPEPEPVAPAKGVVATGQEKAIPGDELVGMDGEKFDKTQIGGKFVGIYFSAKWCPPCRGFTPSLVKFRDKNSEDFEIIFVSSDRNEAAMYDYMKSYEMNFAATKFGSKMMRELQKKYAARGIPHLVILSPDGRVISKNGRGDVSSKGDGALDDWKAAATR